MHHMATGHIVQVGVLVVPFMMEHLTLAGRVLVCQDINNHMFVKIYAMTVLKLRLPVIVVLRGIMEHRQTAQADAQSVPVLELPPQAAQVLQDAMFLLAQQALIQLGLIHIQVIVIGQIKNPPQRRIF